MQIDPLPGEDSPRPQVVYRCSVCRLELVLDERTRRLTVAPLRDTEPPPPNRRRTRKQAS